MKGRPLSLRRRLLFAGVITVATYVLLETVGSIGYMYLWRRDVRLFEGAEQAACFCPIRGYRLTGAPARHTRIVHNVVEYVGGYHGNNQGFPDRDDFEPQRPSSSIRRIAVFGDSFSAATFLGQNWPDRAEDLARQAGQPVQLLNFSLDGIGLANWWSILTRIVEPNGYQFDGVVFVVFSGDLMRCFTVADYRDGVPRQGAHWNWDPASWPTTADEAQPFMQVMGRSVEASFFDEAIAGRTRPRNSFRLVLARGIRKSILRMKQRSTNLHSEVNGQFDAGRQPLIDDFCRFLRERDLPTVIVHLPARNDLLHPENANPLWLDETRAFANALGATLVDGGQAFAGLTPEQLLRCFFVHDGHWNQTGSDRFAEFMHHALGTWPRTELAVRPLSTGSPSSARMK